MESPAERNLSQSTSSSEPMNWALEVENAASRKSSSVSSVDEKLILDGLNSTTNGGKSNGGRHSHHPSNGRSNGHHGRHGPPSSGDALNGGKGGSNKGGSAATNGVKNNAVIVYYSDPQSEINVDQLLTTTTTTTTESKGGKNGRVVNGGSGGNQHSNNGYHNNHNNNNSHFVPKSGGQSNGHHHNHHRDNHNRDGYHRDQHRQQQQHHRQNSGGSDDRRTVFANGGHSPSKFADNWRTKGLRMDQPQYQPVRERIGNGGGHSGSKPNGRGQHQHQQNQSPKSGMPQLQSPSANGKVSGTFSKQQQQQQPPPKQSASPITIYYTKPECSTDVIEQNLQQLQLKQCKSNSAADNISENNAANGATALEKKEEEEEKAPRPNGSTTDVSLASASAHSTPATSQVNNVINGKQEESESTSQAAEAEAATDASSSSDTTATTATITTSSAVPSMPISLSTTGGGDQYDVINGGVPISAATLPTEGKDHPLRCTLVSHPGHFYVKFVDEASEAVLATMNEFYSLEEHLIELSVELLRPGQYFAACRLRPPTAGREWIRVQLQSVEGTELINCLLIDEGCFGIFKCSDLQPLYNQFRTVAKQAVRASLSGVIPKEIDWLPQQSLDFKKLVSDRPLHTGGQVFEQAAFEEKGCLQLELFFADNGEVDDGLAGRSVAEVVVERDIASKK